MYLLPSVLLLLILPFTSPSCVASSDIILPPLPYNYSALEPVISEKIMVLHHTKHHQAYVTNYNKARKTLEDALQVSDLQTIESLQSTIGFNLGGHLNHAFFWKVLVPEKQYQPLGSDSQLLAQINAEWGNLENFKKEFNKKALAIQGSGWCWLAIDRTTRALSIKTTEKQDPVSLLGVDPVFGVDVWEHAYYLDYLNARGDYLENIWRIVNWKQVEANYKGI